MGNLNLYPDAKSLNERERREASAYHFFFRGGPDAPAAITSNTAIPTTGTGYEFDLLPDTVVPLTFGSLQGGIPFFTTWEGSLELTVSTNARLLFLLKTKHVVGDKSFTHTRRHIQGFRNTQEQTLPLVVFNSVSFVRTDVEYTIGDDTHTFDADDVRIAPTIGYKLEIQALNQADDNRKAANITSAAFQNLDTISYQLRHMGPI